MQALLGVQRQLPKKVALNFWVLAGHSVLPGFRKKFKPHFQVCKYEVCAGELQEPGDCSPFLPARSKPTSRRALPQLHAQHPSSLQSVNSLLWEADVVVP